MEPVKRRSIDLLNINLDNHDLTGAAAHSAPDEAFRDRHANHGESGFRGALRQDDDLTQVTRDRQIFLSLRPRRICLERCHLSATSAEQALSESAAEAAPVVAAVSVCADRSGSKPR
jgi:hypothetical protein